MKINDYYWFNDEIDLKDYCNKDKNTKYKLKAVAIHAGGADYGHYYAIIKYDEWLKFNDSDISQFNYSKLADECFGKTNEFNYYDN